MTLMQRFEALYQKLDKAAVTKLGDIYATDIVFIDPVGEHQGLHAVSDYFNQLIDNCTYCEFSIERITQGDELTYVRWVMTYQHPKIKRGQTVTLPGLSELVIHNDRICQQTDYYDLGAMLYEHLPLIGRLIRMIKDRMTS